MELISGHYRADQRAGAQRRDPGRARPAKRAADSRSWRRKCSAWRNAPGEATKQIEAIVKTIQADTQDAVAAMEKSTVGVVEGTKLSDAAGQALDEIRKVSRELAGADRRHFGADAEAIGVGVGRDARACRAS